MVLAIFASNRLDGVIRNCPVKIEHLLLPPRKKSYRNQGKNSSAQALSAVSVLLHLVSDQRYLRRRPLYPTELRVLAYQGFQTICLPPRHPCNIPSFAWSVNVLLPSAPCRLIFSVFPPPSPAHPWFSERTSPGCQLLKTVRAFYFHLCHTFESCRQPPHGRRLHRYAYGSSSSADRAPGNPRRR